MSTGFESNVVTGEMPCRSAVASTIGLNDEPGCRSACVARLNWLSRKFEPPTIARDGAGARVDRDERGGGAARRLEDALDRLVGRLLQLEVDRARHLEAAAEDAAGAVRRRSAGP